MKPIKLIMSAFGSYGGVEEIDFTRVDRGIFLITGDTGAGKTTVFDAITYALFDAASGGSRNGDMMRSQYAAEDTPTFVEYTFSYGGQVYTVKRNPNYQRISRRKNKNGEYTYTTELTGVELTMPDGRVFPGKTRETNEKIREILGVDVTQFTQISMIAQGEFLKLLHAPSRERKEIFARIFDTGIYGQIQNRLKEQARELSDRLGDNRNLLEHELSGVWRLTELTDAWQTREQGGSWDSREELEEAWAEAAVKPETGQEEIFALLDQMEDYIRRQEETQEVRERENRALLDRVKLEIARAEETNRQFARKQETEASILDITNKLAGIQDKLAEWTGHQRKLAEIGAERMPKLEQQLAEARNLLPKYDLLNQRKEETGRLEKVRNQAEKELNSAVKQEALLKKQQEELDGGQRELLAHVEQLPELREQEKECRRRKEELQELCAQGKRLAQEEKRLEVCRRKVSEALAEFETRSRAYEACNRIFIEEQAGLLASALEEGSPCPVCGSTHHPRKAQLSGEAVTEQQVEKAKAEREQAQAKLDAVNGRFQSEKAQYAGEQQVFWNNGKRVFGAAFPQISEDAVWTEGEAETLGAAGEMDERADRSLDARMNTSLDERAATLMDAQSGMPVDIQWNLSDEWLQALENVLAVCTDKVETLEKQRTQLEEKQQQYDRQNRQLEVIANKLSELLENRELLQRKLYEEKLSYEKAAQSLQELAETLTFSSREALEQELGALQKEKQQLEEKQKKIQDTILLLQQQQARGEGSLEEQQKNLKMLITALEGKQPVDIQAFKSREQELNGLLTAAQKQRAAWISGRDRNTRARENLRQLYEERSQLAAKFAVAENLSRTANGNLRQQARVDLVTYVQRRYFGRIIGEANRRLVKMSGGRFILKCRELEQLGRQGETGLELDVYDLVTDQVRDVKTLSGGESFLAALAMALGMADVIQKNAGSVHLDTMFIDEGFGSLDEETRGKAIAILQELAGETRLVGIISHVTEMKEQMDRKLVITKGERGSHASWQLES